MQIPDDFISAETKLKSAQSSKRFRVLFVCLGNACRSPMAEAIAGRDAVDIMEADSAGLIPLGSVAGMTTITLAKNGYATEGLQSKAISRERWDAADLVINMSGRPKQLAFAETTKVEEWSVEDPYGAEPAIYQRILEDIAERVRELAERLRAQTKSST